MHKDKEPYFFFKVTVLFSWVQKRFENYSHEAENMNPFPYVEDLWNVYSERCSAGQGGAYTDVL